jgi:phytoene dehydrogenase-like protein
MGRLRLPMPIAELAARRWDVIIVGAGHNGLACAAYLARAGKRVLVLEARERVGGACTLQESFPGYRISPCAYLAGLLHPLVIRELELPRRGFKWSPALGGYFIPFEDGSSLQIWEDDALAEEEIKKFAPRDLEGWREMNRLIRRTAEALRPPDERDLWIGEAPTRAMIEERVGHDQDAIDMLFDLSMAELLERYVSDERLQIAYLGQGIIGTNASPFDKGTAYIRFHHSCGRIDPKLPGTWGYVEGGMGRVSFMLCDAALEAGAIVAAGVPVAQILPEQGVVLEGGEQLSAAVIVSNADGRATLRLLGDSVHPAWKAKVESIPIQGRAVKVNIALEEPPNFLCRPGLDEPHHRAQINTPLTKAQFREGFEAAGRGELPEWLWTENYLQTAFDPSVAPPGRHLMSVYSQYVPYTFAEGTWEGRREEVGKRVVQSIGRFTSNLPEAIIDMEIMGPPDIERLVGLTGGHVFQGECLPQYMWDRRLQAKTPMPGVYLCGACTHPGGSVIGINGRNAAMRILHDQSIQRGSPAQSA